MPSVLRWTSRISSLVGVLLLALAFASPAAAWGSSVHHDQVIIISDSFKESPSIPADVRENICSDTIYSASLAPDDWRNATGAWGTYQYNMAENAYEEFIRVNEAWEDNDFDNAVYRIGIAMHYVGDAMQMAHNDGVRDHYEANIAPLGSEQPLWSSEESGGHYAHQVHQQIEAYSDSDSAWYPRQPENYGPTDDGSLEWFLNNYFRGPTPLTSDTNTSGYSLDYVMPAHIRQTNPYDGWTTNELEDNRWFYWVETRDPEISKMDFDNSTRLTYNGVYRALRDAYISNGGTWDWPTTTASESYRPYGNGYDVVRWNAGQSERGFSGGESEQEATVQGGAETGATQILLLLVGSAVAAIGISYAWRRWRGRKPRPALKKRRRRS